MIRMELLKGRRHPFVKIPGSRNAYGIPGYIVVSSRWVACAKLRLRRWNSTNDWPAGLQFMPIKVQNYDVRASHRPARQMAFLGFRSVSQDYKPIRMREDRATRRASLRCVSFGLSHIHAHRSQLHRNSPTRRRLSHTVRHVKTPTQRWTVLSTLLYDLCTENYLMDMVYVSKSRFFVTFAKIKFFDVFSFNKYVRHYLEVIMQQ